MVFRCGVLVVESLKSDRELIHLVPLLELKDKQLVHEGEVGGHDDGRLQGEAYLAEALGHLVVVGDEVAVFWPAEVGVLHDLLERQWVHHMS